MKDYKKQYEVFLKMEKSTSKNTYDAYIRDLEQFFTYLNSISVSPLKSDAAIIEKYINTQQRSGKSHSTLTRILASLRCYYGFLLSMRIIKSSPVQGIKISKVQKKLPEILTNNEVELLLSQPDCTELKGCRDKAMLVLIYATGIKVSELISLTVNDINLQMGILHINSSKNERIVPIYPEAIKLINNYLMNVRDIVVSDHEIDSLFTNMNGKPMTRQGFWKIIKHYADCAKINKDITPHTLRHSFATHLLENGAPIKDVKEILGYNDISSTQIYSQLIKNKYTETYKKYHPMAR